ncbi:MAG: ABC transporter ATP-binding protein [Bacteroidota bacterium]
MTSNDERSIWQKFWALIAYERKEIFYIHVYAVLTGFISLSLPLGIQSLFSFISAGQISTSVIVLIGLIFTGVLAEGGLQVMQLYLLEHIQQKIFTRTAFEFSLIIPAIRQESLYNHYPPELVNRFFEVVTLQKSLGKVLMDFATAFLQLAFGLVLLSFYHTYFIFFGAILAIILAGILYFTGRPGLDASLIESGYKYRLVHWLQEIARAHSTFKMSGNAAGLEKTDTYTTHYLEARNRHFKILIIQYMSFVGFKSLITAALLIVGCILLVNKQINLGQFVASEIIIILIMNAVEKVMTQLDSVYDLLTGAEKLSHVTSMPIQTFGTLSMEPNNNATVPALRVRDLHYMPPGSNRFVFKGVSFDVMRGQHACIISESSQARNHLVSLLMGMAQHYEGSIAVDGLSMRDIKEESLYSFLAGNNDQELFSGSILDNVRPGRGQVSLPQITSALSIAGLDNFLHTQSHGLSTQLKGSVWIPKAVAEKLVLARCIAARPRLLILVDPLVHVANNERDEILQRTLDELKGATVLFICKDDMSCAGNGPRWKFADGKLKEIRPAANSQQL